VCKGASWRLVSMDRLGSSGMQRLRSSVGRLQNIGEPYLRTAEFEDVCKDIFALRNRQVFHFVIFETNVEAI